MTQHIYGASFEVGLGSTNQGVHGYQYVLSSRLNSNISNHAQSGAGTWRNTKEAFTSLPTHSRTSTDFPVYGCSAYNDVWRGANTANTLLKIQGNLRAFLANAFLKTALPLSDSSFTKTGTWGAMNGSLFEKAPTLSGTGMYSASAGDTITGTFSGDNLVIGTFNCTGAPTARLGSFNVTIAGIVYGPYDFKGYTDGLGDLAPWDDTITYQAVILRGLGNNASQTFTITLLENLTTFLDYIGTLDYPSVSSPVGVSGCPMNPPAGWLVSPTTGPAVWSQYSMEAANTAIKDVVSEFFDYPVRYIEVNDWYDPLTGCSTDNRHPNDIGHASLASAWTHTFG